MAKVNANDPAALMALQYRWLMAQFASITTVLDTGGRLDGPRSPMAFRAMTRQLPAWADWFEEQLGEA